MANPQPGGSKGFRGGRRFVSRRRQSPHDRDLYQARRTSSLNRHGEKSNKHYLSVSIFSMISVIMEFLFPCKFNTDNLIF
jgi:hypothetical protein